MAALQSPDANGHLRLKGNPGPWIQNNPSASRHLVKHLELDFNLVEYVDRIIDDSIDELSFLTRLTVSNAKSFRCLPNSISTLPHLQNVEFSHCSRVPNNLGVLKTSLTNLSYSGCSIKSLPESILTLSNLTSLYIRACDRLTELPDGFGQLRSLKHLSLLYCDSLHHLPNSMSNLLNLETLCIEDCSSLTELPVNLNVTYLQIIRTRSGIFGPGICSIPRGLSRLRHLKFAPDFSSDFTFSHLKDSVHFQILNMDCSFLYDFTKLIDLNQLVNLQVLSFHNLYRIPHEYGVKFFTILEGLHQLVLLDIQDTVFNYLPWSILKLSKLRYLLLPRDFRLQTLPFHLNDSVLISVEGRHIRKPWNQLKQEIGVSPFPIAQVEACEYPSTIAPPGYLSVQGDLAQWISDNYESRLQVKTLELLGGFDSGSIQYSIGELPCLTHLFVTYCGQRNCLPDTIESLKHVSLHWGDFTSRSHPINLDKLSNLETLDLIIGTFPSKPNLPVSLKRLSLQSSYTSSLPASMAKLSNLRTLELSECRKLTSLFPLNIVTLKTDWINKSFLPIGLRHLEILHVKNNCLDKYRYRDCGINLLEPCLTQLVNLETFSLTCYHIKSLPSMAQQRSLRVLLLKNCFALKELQPDMDQLVELQTLDISGTRIKYLPDSIMKLSKLQQLTLPKCLTQKLPRKLEEVSIIDETDKRYYKHMGYFDSDFEPISCSVSEDNNAAVNSIGGVNEEIKEEPIQGVIDEQICEQTAESQVPKVSRSTMKRTKNGHQILCSSSKRSKQFHDAKEEDEPNIDSPSLEKPFKPADHGHEDKVSKGATATMATVKELPFDSVKESHMKAPQHVEVHLDAANQSNIVQPNGKLSSFNFVKACYEGDPVWIDFSTNSSFDQLNVSICKKFGLEMNKFKIKYLDEDEEWFLMTCLSDLTHALVHTSSSGKKFVRLSVTNKGAVYAGRASEEIHEQIIPKESEGRSTWVFVQSGREKSNYIQCAGENSNQPAFRDSINFPEFYLPHIKPLIEGHRDVKADGNCGFRVIATFEYGDEEKWLDVRIDLLKELNTNKDFYKKTLGGNEEFERAKHMVNWLISPAEKMHWFEATCLGLVVATKYQKIFTCWSTECCTYLPLVSRLADHKPPTMYINMGRINSNHFMALQMPNNIPLPPLSPLWKRHCCYTVKHWSTIIFKKQLDDYLQLLDKCQDIQHIRPASEVPFD